MEQFRKQEEYKQFKHNGKYKRNIKKYRLKSKTIVYGMQRFIPILALLSQ